MLAALAVGLVMYGILYSMPNSPIHAWLDLNLYNASPNLASTRQYQDLISQIDVLELWLVSPLTMLAAGLVLGRIIGDDYGTKHLYQWALGISAFMIGTFLAFLWGNKLVHQGMRLTPWDLPPSLIVAQLIAFIFWVGMAVVGAEIGRRFHKSQTGSPAAT
jgi:hypothetical protein